MVIEEITYKDLTKSELEDLKDYYVKSRLYDMSEDDLRAFVKTVIEDQVKGTVGHQEEKEAWNEIKDYYQEEFETIIKKFKKTKKLEDDNMTIEEIEYQKRLKLLEKRDNYSPDLDMWKDD